MKLRGKVRFSNFYAGSGSESKPPETHVGVFGKTVTASLWFPGDVSTEFHPGQEVEVTVEAVAEARPAPGSSPCGRCSHPAARHFNGTVCGEPVDAMRLCGCASFVQPTTPPSKETPK